MEVHLFDQQNDLIISPSQVQMIVREVLKLEQVECDEVAIHFVTTSSISELHRIYFDDPTPTDCISFPMDSNKAEGYCVLGEVFVCPQTAIEYAALHPTTPHEEVTLYIIHGLLHLLGYEDQGDRENEMRQAEQRHLHHLKKKGCTLKEDACLS